MSNMRHFSSAIFVMGTSILVAAFVISPLFRSLRVIGSEQVAMVSQVGAHIIENPTNKLALEFKNRAEELDRKEKRLIEMQAALEEEQTRVAYRVRNVLVGSIGLSLLTLFIMNYVIRKRIEHSENQHELSHEYQKSLVLNEGLRIRLIDEHK